MNRTHGKTPSGQALLGQHEAPLEILDQALEESDPEASIIWIPNSHIRDGENEEGKDECAVEYAYSPPTRASLRHVAVETAGVYISYFGLGMVCAVVGATFLALELQTGKGADELSMLFTWAFVGRLPGSFLVGAIFDRFSAELQLGIASLVVGITTPLMTLWSSYIAMSVILAIQGVAIGFIGGGTHTLLFRLWGDKIGPVLQALYFVCSCGSALTPPLTAIFVDQATAGLKANGYNCSLTQFNGSIIGNTSLCESRNSSSLGTMTQKLEKGVLNTSDGSDAMHVSVSVENHYTSIFIFNGDLFYPYLIVGIVPLIATVISIVMFTLHGCNVVRTAKKKSTVTAAAQTAKTNFVLVMLFSAILFCSCGTEISFGGLVLTYAVHSLDWTQTNAIYVSTVYWALLAGGRACGIPISKYVRPELLLGSSLSLTVLTTITLAIGSNIDQSFLWICSGVLGFTLSIVAGGTFHLAGTYMTISGRVSAIFMTAIFGGGMVVPALSGYLFEKVTHEWFVYVKIIFSICSLVAFITIVMYGRTLTRDSAPNGKVISDVDVNISDVDVNDKEKEKL